MKHLSKLALLAAAFFTGLSANAQSIDAFDGQSQTISSDQTCTKFSVFDGSTLTVNQGVTLTLNISNDNNFKLYDNSTMQLHGTLTGSVASGARWHDNSYINVYLSDGAKYTVTGLTCMNGDNYLRYYGYDAATNGHGTVSVTNGPTAVTASSIGYMTTTYTFTATPASGYHFVSWTKGAGGEELGTDASISVTCEQNGRYQVYANFEEDAPTPHTVRMAEGTEDAANWTLASGNASVPGTQVLENVMSGSELTATYNGDRKVKSVKAVKYVAPAATVTTAPTATAALIEANSAAALVNAGAANGGTMMYAVTTTNAQPASTADFSASIPTAQGRTAGTYYVWYYAKADAEHSDSEIAGPVSVTVTSAATTVTWNSSNVSDLNVMGTFQSYTKEGITLSANADQIYAEWMDYGNESMNGISFQANGSGGYTFTAPTGKQFTKIEMTLTNSGGWDMASLGTGWAFGVDYVNFIYKVTWTGSAASTVGLLTGADNFGGERVKSIVFTLIEAQ